jgi:hypothetical protein
MVKVFSYSVWDDKTGAHVTMPRKGTVQRVEHAGGVIVQGSDEEVSEELVDKFGTYNPPQPSGG